MAKKYKPDLIIVTGDFDCFDEPQDPGIPVLWVGISTTQKAPGNFGQTVYVTAEKE